MEERRVHEQTASASVLTPDDFSRKPRLALRTSLTHFMAAMVRADG